MDEHLVRLLENIEGLLRILAGDKVRALMAEARENKAYATIIETLLEKGEMQASPLKDEVAKALGLSPRRAQDRIQELTAKGILRSRREAKNIMYSISELVG